MTIPVNQSSATFFALGNWNARPLEARDAPLVYRWVNNPELRPYFNRTFMELITDEEAWISDLAKRKHQNQVWMIEVDGTPTGTMGLHGIDFINRTATTGAMFGDLSKHNQGIGQQVKMLLLDHAFNVMNLRQVYSEVISFNLRSLNYSKKCGYQVVATIPNAIAYRGQFYDRIIMMVTKAEFEMKWEQFRTEHQIESFEDMLKRHKNWPRN